MNFSDKENDPLHNSENIAPENEDLGYFTGWFFTFMPLIAFILFIYYISKGYSRKASQIIFTPLISYFIWFLVVFTIQDFGEFATGLIGLILIFLPIIVVYYLRKLEWPKRSIILHK